MTFPRMKLPILALLTVGGPVSCCPPRYQQAAVLAQPAPAATQSRVTALTGQAGPYRDPAVAPLPSWEVDFDFEGESGEDWRSEWNQVQELAVVSLGGNRRLRCRWNTAKGFDLTRILAPPEDLSRNQRVSFQLYLPPTLARRQPGLKIWLDDKWPGAPQLRFDAEHGGRWLAVQVAVGELPDLTLAQVHKLGIYLEVEGGGAEETELFLDNIGLD